MTEHLHTGDGPKSVQSLGARVEGDDEMHDVAAFERLAEQIKAAVDEDDVPPDYPEGFDGSAEEVEAEKDARKAERGNDEPELYVTAEAPAVAAYQEGEDESEYTPHFESAAEACEAIDWIWKRERKGMNRRSMALLGKLREDLQHARDRELL